ncbi:MAG: cyclic nucleotide-binding domain-containing protein [Betaproteobacteria bacterium]
MEDDFDFTKPQTVVVTTDTAVPPLALQVPFKPTISKFYDSKVAARFFETSGRREFFPAGQTMFLEDERSGKQGLFGKRVIHRMYFITVGEVTLSIAGKVIDTIKPGEIFGEMAVISETPAGSTRSAAAVVKTDCNAYSLDTEELQNALSRTPEFALMLMSVMFDRLRFVAARLATRKLTADRDIPREAAVFDGAALASLEQKLERATTIRYLAGKPIMNEGDSGTSMYILLDGMVAISIKGKIVERVATGGTFGEMALVDQSPRTASAVAETECALLAFNRATLVALVKAEPAVGLTMLRSVAARLRHMNSLLT